MDTTDGLTPDQGWPFTPAGADHPSQAAGLAEGTIDGWRDFADRVCAALAWGAARSLGLVLSDPDFRSWPLGDRAVVGAMQHWALSQKGQRLTVLLADAESIPRHHPRWLIWRRDWAHRVSVHQADAGQVSEVPTMLLLGQELGLRVLEPLRGRGIWTRDPSTLSRWREDIDAILQRSHPALPVTTLGL